MGRPGCPARKHFVQWGSKKVNSAHYPFRCKRCLAKHYLREAARQLENPQTDPGPGSPWSPPITGRQTNFDNHLRIVHKISDPASVPAPPTPTPNGPFEVSPPRTPPPRRLQHPAAPSTENLSESGVSGVYKRNYTPAQRRQFERFLLEFQVDNALPDSFVERPATKRLLFFLNPACLAYIPSRRVMGGRIMNDYASEYVATKSSELRKRQQDTGGRLNLLSDVWQNISRTHLLGVHLTLFGLVLVEGLHEVGSEHHAIALARQMETLIEALLKKGWRIGAIVTDNAGQCERARRILAVRWPSIHFGKCFAHDINNLVKAILRRTGFRSVADQACAAVYAMNRSSSKWLKRVNAVMMELYELVKPLAFLSLCYTRWNSMQACFASLLRVKTGLRQFAARFQFTNDLPKDVLVFLDEVFWSTLADAERTIRPLCNASYILQRDENTLVDVVMCFRDIFDSFVAGPHAKELIPLVEERWADCEQPLTLLAVFLHPGYLEVARALPNKGVSSIDSISNFGVFYFKRFFPGREYGMLRYHIVRWCESTLYIGTEHFRFDEFPSVAEYWKYAKGKSAGPNLPDLALAVLSIAANTATCERYFSALGRIHTPARNCLKADKTNKAAMASQAVKERDRLDNQDRGLSGSVNADDGDVVDEDSEGNKYAGRIIKSVERQFRRDCWVSHHSSNSTTTGRTPNRLPASLNSFTSPNHLSQAAFRPPDTPGFPLASPNRSNVTPSRPHSTVTRPSVTSSRRYSRRSIEHPSHGTSIRFRSLEFTNMDSNDEGLFVRDDNVDTADSEQAGAPVEESSESSNTIAQDILSHWCESFDHISDSPMHSSTETDASMLENDEESNQEDYDERQLRLRPIPEYNDTRFPQEPRKLPGLRGRKNDSC